LQLRTAVETLDETKILAGIEMPTPIEAVRNDVSVIVRPFSEQTSGVLWIMGDTPLVGAGQSITLWGEFSSSNSPCSATSVIAPVATTDYLANTLTSGLGSDLTGSFTVTATIYGNRAMFVVENTGAVDGYVIFLRIRGKALTAHDTTINDQDATSIARYRSRIPLKIDTNWIQSTEVGVDISDLLIYLLASAQRFPRVRLKNQPALQFAPGLFDPIHLDFPSKFIDDDYLLSYIEHTWVEPTGNIVESNFYFEPVNGAAEDMWIFPAVVGITTRLSA
jgi:hypothetical protein